MDPDRHLRRGAALLAVVAGLAAGPAQPGAWPRKEGEVFLSFTHQQGQNGDTHDGIYAEYGYSPRLTLGMEAGLGDSGTTAVLVWAQRSFTWGERDHFAALLGVGMTEEDGLRLPLGQIAASWGRGLDTRFGTGWLAVDAKLRLAGTAKPGSIRIGWRPEVLSGYLDTESALKVDVTLGLRPWGPRTMFINQVWLEYGDDSEVSARLATSVVRDLTRWSKIEIGLVQPLRGQSGPALKLGTWIEF